MDPVTIAYYASICAVLSAIAPATRRWPMRLALGAAVGIAAAMALPSVREALGV